MAAVTKERSVCATRRKGILFFSRRRGAKQLREGLELKNPCETLGEGHRNTSGQGSACAATRPKPVCPAIYPGTWTGMLVARLSEVHSEGIRSFWPTLVLSKWLS